MATVSAVQHHTASCVFSWIRAARRSRNCRPGKKVDQRGCRVRIKPKDWEKIRVWLWMIEQAEK